MVLNRFKFSYFQLCVLFLLFSCNEEKDICETKGEIYDGKLIEFNSEQDWADIIVNRKVIVIEKFYPGRKWVGNTFIFKSDELCKYNIQMNKQEAKQIQNLYEYQWQTNQTTLRRKFRIYSEVDSVKYLGLENSGLGMGSKFEVYGEMVCLEIDVE